MVLAERKVIDKLKYVIPKNCLLLSADIHPQADSEKLLSHNIISHNNHKHNIKVTSLRKIF